MISNYIPGEFTISVYEFLLQLVVKKFKFVKYTDVNPCENYVLWRHDIDFSLEQAVKIAEIEHRSNIRSTYFVHLHNDFYNALDSESFLLIKKIISCNHSIGLHFDINYYDIRSSERLNYWLKFEKNILENLFGEEIQVFSFHNTNEISMSFEDESYAEMINTYSNYFKTQVSYCSDSNGYWRYRKLVDVLNDDFVTQLQVLTHPVWWSDKELMPRTKIIRCAERRRFLLVDNYDKALIASNRVNIE